MDPLDTLLAYHQRTKHALDRYAAGPGRLDWASQPDPFRHFAGSPQLPLPLLSGGPQPRYSDLSVPANVTPQAMTLKNIAALFELSFGLSAWKQYGGERWALRCNPSSGNLHPTEAYAVGEGIHGIDAGLHHYLSRDHAFELRCRFDAAAGGARRLPPGTLLVGLTSIHWREAWKYGERAYRYCQLDVGHAIAAVRYAAATIGWQARILDTWSDAMTGTLLGADRHEDFGDAERECPELMLAVSTCASDFDTSIIDADALLSAARSGHWHGRANPLSAHHLHDWPVIEQAAHACVKPETPPLIEPPATLPPLSENPSKQPAIEIIRQRRSAQAFDGVSTISAGTFYRMLDATLLRSAVPPFDAAAWAPRIHLVLFVHRVQNLAPGLYLFLRNGAAETRLRDALSPVFAWQRVAGCPAHLPLFQLVPADMRDTARTLCCQQDIASDGAYGVGMLAKFRATLNDGAWRYRQLFWEAGMIGQTLYLEAEAAGVRGTGIGCYFDDAVHDMLGINGDAFQSLYHFTVGTALVDNRLQTLPPYAHLSRG